MALATLTASFRSAPLSQDRIDHEAGVLYGVKIAELGKTARWQGKDQAHSTVVSSDHIDAFLRLAGDRSIICHWTHDHTTASVDPLHSKVGAMKNIRKDDGGSLIGDLHISPGDYRDRILWNAVNDPSGMMISPIFQYAQNDKRAIPLTFKAADLVENGAATVALFSASTEPDNTMTPEDIQKVVDTAVEARFAAFEKNQVELETARLAAAPAPVAPITEEEVKSLVDARFAEAKDGIITAATAKLTTTVGTGAFQLNAATKSSDDVDARWSAAVAEHTSNGIAPATAEAMVATANAALYAERRASIFRK